MPRYSRRRRSVKVSPLLRKKIRKVIQGVAEKKGFATNPIVNSVYNSILTTPPTAQDPLLGHWGGISTEGAPNVFNLVEFTSLIKAIQPGQSASTRIGDVINVSKFELEGFWFADPQGQGGVTTTMMIVSFKLSPQGSQALPVAGSNVVLGPGGSLFSNFLRDGDNTIGPQGILTDMARPVNSQMVTVHYRKTFKLGNAVNLNISEYKPVRPFRINLLKMLSSRRVEWLEPATQNPQVLNVDKLWLVVMHNTLANTAPTNQQSFLNQPVAQPFIQYRVDCKWTDM